MKHRQVIVFLAMVVVAVGAFAVGRWYSENRRGGPDDAPPICFWPVRLDLGDVTWHSEVPFEMSFRNDGKAPVALAALKSSCGCTVIDSSQYAGRVVKPGEQIAIRGELSTGAGLGKRERTLELMLADGAVYTGLVAYHTNATYSFTPEGVKYSTLKLDEESDEGTIARVVFRSKSAKLVGAPESDMPWIEATTVDRQVGETEIVLRAQKHYMKFGSNHAQVRVTTDDPYQPVFTVYVDANGQMDLRPIPEFVMLRRGQSRQVDFMRTGSNERCKLASAETEAKGLALTINEQGFGVRVEADERFGADQKTALVRVVDEAGRRSHVVVALHK